MWGKEIKLGANVVPTLKSIFKFLAGPLDDTNWKIKLGRHFAQGPLFWSAQKCLSVGLVVLLKKGTSTWWRMPWLMLRISSWSKYRIPIRDNMCNFCGMHAGDMLSETICTAYQPQELQLEINGLDSDDETAPPVWILIATSNELCNGNQFCNQFSINPFQPFWHCHMAPGLCWSVCTWWDFHGGHWLNNWTRDIKWLRRFRASSCLNGGNIEVNCFSQNEWYLNMIFPFHWTSSMPHLSQVNEPELEDQPCETDGYMPCAEGTEVSAWETL